ncbi:class I SAM-dependent methyltransferase [Zobellia barbeyronii]|uniref:Class I SAM-dependent methyltransferase n=1 Tax=Zobellia barbeyronii TaxID=2748009 RepID=A0ABS5W9R9_9FLAO|nr:class I SAM-dependent methyltransferase [Zobellia barbeyronii]MBT2160158.1 class I SAM-dependent methyltransferase [Zobellia barbeyronii]
MNCPLCSSQSEFVFEIKGFDILDCGSCNHRYAKVKADEKHVVQTYGDSYFNEGEGGYADYLQNSELLYERGKLYAKKVQKITNKKGRVLDVGAAAGFILKGYLDNGWSGMGIEPNLQMTKYGQKEYGLDIQQGSFESFKADDKFDLISMIQVVAHFYDQQKAFENASKLLEDDGLLLIESWDRSSISAKIFGKNWHEYAPPSVLHWYSVESLTNFLKTFGFEKVAHGRPSKKISGRHIKSVLKYRFGENFLLKMIPDKIILPYPSEDLFWALYRKKAL